MRRLGEALSGLKAPKFSHGDIYSNVWCRFNGVGGVGCFAVADGSCASSMFRGGVRVIVVRAAALSYAPLNDGWVCINRIHDIDVKIGFRLKRASLYMRALEFKCLTRALDGGVSLAICDGHIYPIIHPAIYKRAHRVVEAYHDFLSSLLSLYREAWRRGIALIGLVKDSVVNYVRARLIAQAISNMHREAAAGLSRERSPSRILKALRSMGVADPIVEELEAFTSDEEAFDEYIKEPGFSTPLALAPQPIFFSEEVKAGVGSWWDTNVRRRLMDADRDDLRKIAAVLDSLYDMPPTVIFYWRPWHGAGIFRVDVSGWSLGLNHSCGDMCEDMFLSGEAVEKCREIVAALNALSPRPHAVKPLADVDLIVRLDQRAYREFYEPQIIEAMKKAGFKAQLTKREMRERFFMR